MTELVLLSRVPPKPHRESLRQDIFASKEDIVWGAVYLAKEKADEKKEQLKEQQSNQDHK